MVCFHYEVFAYDSKHQILATVIVYSFDEAYYFIDDLRERYPKAVEFTIKYPDEDIVKIGKSPAEDVAPVVHAKWETGRCTNCHTDKPIVMASVMQGYIHQYQGRLNYCPNCGAKMMEEE